MNPGNNDDNVGHLSNAERRRRRKMQNNRNCPGSSSSNQSDQSSNGINCLPVGQRVYAESDGNSGDCPVCLMPYLYPIVLPCGHMFCYLCIKGIVRSGASDAVAATCPMCRSSIPKSVTMKPTLYEPLKTPSENDATEYKWFYERRKKNGWWQYDERTNKEIEAAYTVQRESLEVLLCGEIYVIDLKEEVQYPKNDPLRKRRITRGTLNQISPTGVSGIE